MLLVAHQIFVVAAMALGAIFGIRAAVHFSRAHATIDLVLAIASLLVTVALGLYFPKVRARYLRERAARPAPAPRPPRQR